MGCTLDDIGRVVKLGKRTLIRRMGDAKFQEAIERGRAKGRCSLRKAQFDAALDGNVTAQIWLGKQLLNQRSFERPEPEKPPEKPDKIVYEWVSRKSEESDANPFGSPIQGVPKQPNDYGAPDANQEGDCLRPPS